MQSTKPSKQMYHPRSHAQPSVVKDTYGQGFLSVDDPALHLMTTVSHCTKQNAHELIDLENDFWMLDEYGDSVLKHAIKANNYVALNIISRSKYFDTIKGIQNKGGEYAVFTAAIQGKDDILKFLLSNPRDCKIMPPESREGGAPSILHEVILENNNSDNIMRLLLNDLRNKAKYSDDEVERIISFSGGVDGYGQIDPYNLALRTGRKNIASMLSAFVHDYHAR